MLLAFYGKKGEIRIKSHELVVVKNPTFCLLL